MRRLLPEPFWTTLAALLVLSLLTAIIPYVVCVLIWPHATGTDLDWMVAGSYLLAVPLTWALFRPANRRWQQHQDARNTDAWRP
jgi:type VI protein secretion system component VasK